MSTNSGRAPACEIASVVAMKVLRDGDHRVTGLNAGGHQCKPQRIGAAAHGDGVLHLAEVGEPFLKILDHGAANETGSPDRLLKDLG